MTNFFRLIKTYLFIKNFYVFWILNVMKALCTLTQGLCKIVSGKLLIPPAKPVSYGINSITFKGSLLRHGSRSEEH